MQYVVVISVLPGSYSGLLFQILPYLSGQTVAVSLQSVKPPAHYVHEQRRTSKGSKVRPMMAPSAGQDHEEAIIVVIVFEPMNSPSSNPRSVACELLTASVTLALGSIFVALKFRPRKLGAYACWCRNKPRSNIRGVSVVLPSSAHTHKLNEMWVTQLQIEIFIMRWTCLDTAAHLGVSCV